MYYLNAWHFRNDEESLKDTGMNDGVRRGQKEDVKQSKTQESFSGIADKLDIEEVL